MNERDEARPAAKQSGHSPQMTHQSNHSSVSPSITGAGAQESKMLEAALGYARRGWPVFPVWPPAEDGGCACHKGLDCPSPAKHPMGDFVPGGVTNATTDPDVIRAWWSRRPRANIGMATGRRSGIVVVDVDLDKGGFETLAALIQQYEEWPTTPAVRTGGGGLHVFFRSPEDTEIRNDAGKKLGPGLDIRGKGGYVLLPPSTHATRRVYEWEGGEDG